MGSHEAGKPRRSKPRANVREERVRSSASPPHSPLTRCPLSGRCGTHGSFGETKLRRAGTATKPWPMRSCAPVLHGRAVRL